MITIEQYAMGRDKVAPDEWANAKPNVEKLLPLVNAFLGELFPGRTFGVSSGFRPAAVNAATPGAAKHSTHLIGKGVDIDDHSNFLKTNLDPENNAGQAATLRRYGLFMECRKQTPTWCHLDIGDRADRPSRVFSAK